MALKELQLDIQDELNEMYGLIVSTGSKEVSFLDKLQSDLHNNELHEIAVGNRLYDSVAVLGQLVFALQDYKPRGKMYRPRMTAWNTIIMQLHIVCQELYDVLYLSGLNHEYIKQEYPIIFRVKIFANFLKHPKTRLLLHNPDYYYIGFEWRDDHIEHVLKQLRKSEQILAEDEIKKYYSRDDANKERNFAEKYANKHGVKVILPSIALLMADTFGAIIKTNEMIAANPVLYDSIKSKASLSLGDIDDMIDSYYEMQAEIARGR